MSPLKQGKPQPREVWKLDMRAQLGVFPIGAPMYFLHSCSIAAHEDRIYVTTGNGFDYEQQKVPTPNAPSLICLDKHTGQLLWQDNSPGANILEGQWSSPLVVEVAGRTQVIVAQGDGWVRSFDPANGNLIWKFDLNPKTARWVYGSGNRRQCMATPVLYQERIYIATGRNAAEGEGPGRLVCIDPTKLGDISTELAYDQGGRPLPDDRIQIADLTLGHRVTPNPNSGLVWECVTSDHNADGKIEFEEGFHLTYGNVVIKADLLVAVDFSGVVHCLDASTGQRHWDYDMFAAVMTSPLIVDDLVYVADEDGEVAIFKLSADTRQPMATISMGASVYTSPVFANGVLYIANGKTLFAIAQEPADAPQSVSLDVEPQGFWPQWRGPNRDNISTETSLLQSWPEGGPPLAWRVHGLGQGISGVSVAGGRVFTLGEYDSTEYVRALQESSGQDLWVTELGGAPRQSATMRWLTQRPPTVDQERVYAVSLLGELRCLRCADGQLLWRRNYPAEFGGKSGVFGFSDCPLVYHDKLLCTPGGAEASIVALDKSTGRTLWTCAIPDAGGTAYANGVIATLAEQVQLVAFLEKSLVGIELEQGRLLWRSDRPAVISRHPHTPLIRDNVVTCIHGAPNGSEAEIYRFEVRQNAGNFVVQELFTSEKSHVISRYTDDTIQLENELYDTDNGIFNCFDFSSGQWLWRNRIGARATMTYADARFYFHESDGKVRLIQAGVQGPSSIAEFLLPEHVSSQGTTTPVVAGGQLYIREDDQLYCYDIGQDTPSDAHRNAPIVSLARPAAVPDSANRDRTLRSVFVPTPQDIVDKMLEMANPQSQEVVYDLGSGDGRIVITAAKQYGCRGVGYELDAQLVELARAKAVQAEVAQLVTIEQADLFTADLEQADIIALYLLPNQLEKLSPQLAKLRPGARIVSHYFELPGFVANATRKIRSQEDGDEHLLHLYTIPLTPTASVPAKD